jgi:hypothetical protein
MSPTALVSPWRRNIIQEIPDTLSSWDKCMAKSYCKYVLNLGGIIADGCYVVEARGGDVSGLCVE